MGLPLAAPGPLRLDMGQTLGCLEKPAADAKPGEEGKHLLGEGGAVVSQPDAAPGAADSTGSGDDGTEDDERDSDEAPPLVVLDAKDFEKRYKLKDVVGQGITSTVHICERLGDGGSAPRRCACKLVNKRKLAADPSLREHLNEQLANEIGLLARLQHDNIVQLFGRCSKVVPVKAALQTCTGDSNWGL